MQKLKIPAAEASSRPLTGHSSAQSRKTLLLQRQRILFSAFRADQYSDPDGYMASLGLVLEQYPDDVVIYITDPRTGVQRHAKWPPTISEVVDACDNRIAELKKAERYRNWGKNDPTLLERPKAEKPTLEQLKAKYGENWGLDPTGGASVKAPWKAQSWDEITSGYAADPSRLARLLDAKDR